MDKQREKRSTNWTEAEKVATVHLILDNEERLFGKFRGASCGAKEKERIWQGIADELNSTGKTAVHRSVDEIKTMYKNMKSRAKDKHAQRKKTGGGPQVTMTAAEEVMLDHLLSHNPEQMEGVKGGVDSSSDLTTKTTVGTSAVPTKEPTKEPTGDYQSNQWMTTWDACAAKVTVGTVATPKPSVIKTPKRRREDGGSVLLELEEKRMRLEIKEVEQRMTNAEEVHSLKIRAFKRNEELDELKKQLLNHHIRKALDSDSSSLLNFQVVEP